MEKYKKYLTKNNIIIGVVVLVVIIGGWYFISNRKTDVLKGDAVTATFKGYDGNGTMTVSSTKSDKLMTDALVKKVGMSDSLKNRIILYSSGNLLSEENLSYYVEQRGTSMTDKEKQQVAQLETFDREITLTKLVNGKEYSSVSGLSNGDKVEFSINVTDDKDNPIKNSTKTIKVKGLKKATEYDAQKLLKHVTFKVSGLNGAGGVYGNDSVKLDSYLKNKFGNVKPELKINSSTKYKNGDQVTVNVKNWINRLGDKSDKNKFTNVKNTKVKIDGLTDVSNVDSSDLVKQVTDLVATKEGNLTKATFYHAYLSYVSADKYNLEVYYTIDASDLTGIFVAMSNAKGTQYFTVFNKSVKIADGKLVLDTSHGAADTVEISNGISATDSDPSKGGNGLVVLK